MAATKKASRSGRRGTIPRARGQIAQPLRSPKLQIVVKVSKQCNLRCSYCYEYPYLSNKSIISLSQFERCFTHLASYRFDHRVPFAGYGGLDFIWHGGEPFLVPIEHYEGIGALQSSILKTLNYTNVIQTNLTVLTDRHIDWLKSGRFIGRHGVGFSFDVYGDQRVDILNRQTTNKVLKNLNILLENDIPVSGITVLSKSTLPMLRNIFHFYSGIDVDFRLLPYHLETQPWQTIVNGISADEIANAMCNLFDLWFLSKTPVTIAPLNEYIEDAIAFINNRKEHYYDKSVDESIFIVDTNGNISGNETYLAEHCYGNIFEQPFDRILASETRRALVSEAARRVDAYCTRCEFFGSCSGFPVAEVHPMEEQRIQESGCYVAKVLSHIVERLSGAGLGRLPVSEVSVRT